MNYASNKVWRADVAKVVGWVLLVTFWAMFAIVWFVLVVPVWWAWGKLSRSGRPAPRFPLRREAEEEPGGDFLERYFPSAGRW